MRNENELARRLLPPLPALRALEALERLGSATAVARELDLTQSAVSRQLVTLEAQLGVTLIHRERKRLVLTDEARAYAATVREALNRLSEAALTLRGDRGGGALSLAILPSFGMRWLVPRLPDFTRRHPEVTVNMTTRLRPFRFADESFDAAIHFGAPDWPGTDHLLLKTERVLPLASPSLVPAPLPPEKLRAQPLLHIQTRPEAWPNWFAAQGVASGSLSGAQFDQFTTILQAALHGLGVALMPDYLAETERAAGRLVPASTAPPVTLGGYHLVWPTGRPMPSALRHFRDWLATQAEDDDPLPR
ncbi:LysR substrate-binding domain-containing protein [Aestuariicoccus sp. MJ-SS9]|uniref:LysR substrate-binding domain-containing protein n=1 Tax=Aestuariicoccus sp. MJ-SS9 TaxID=3079855 RepID=UPI0029157317|nr:LysR substrate-binding domain-containing protein [Aestuariicoccus sp. MJ-SS9]MDU8912091.1 LysR substrate-binding domain-containing protein [Aestuariicoccus sp. MJ-SS9]